MISALRQPFALHNQRPPATLKFQNGTLQGCELNTILSLYLSTRAASENSPYVFTAKRSMVYTGLMLYQLYNFTGAKPNVQEKDGLTPLHLAVYHGHASCVKCLIEHGADVNSTSR